MGGVSGGAARTRLALGDPGARCARFSAVTGAWGLARWAAGALVAVAVSLPVGILVGSALTGHDRRGYSTVAGDADLDLKGTTRTASEWAERYRPVTLADPDNLPPELRTTLVEVVDAGETVVLLYHRVWAPTPPRLGPEGVRTALLAAAAGAPAQDSDRIAVTVNRSDGVIATVLFTGGVGPGDDSPGAPVSVSREANGGYWQSTDGLPPARVRLTLRGARIVLGSAGAGHHTQVIPAGKSRFTREVPSGLEELTADRYADGKFARERPAGPYTTTEHDGDRHAVAALASAVFLAGCLAWPLARRTRARSAAPVGHAGRRHSRPPGVLSRPTRLG